MIGLVLVSHSTRLAEGVRELAQQMVQGHVPIAIAGGIDDPINPIGTDPMKVVQAITEVYHDDGVVILMDLGSALMSAETALEFINVDWQPNIYLCEAPMVEGAISAAVQASLGSPIQQVLAEARSALLSKQQHLAPFPAATTPTQAGQPGADTKQLRVIIPNTQGIHARPGAKIATLANQYKAALTIRKGDTFVNAGSINQVALLGAKQGDELIFYAEGDDADALLQAVQALADDHFGDQHTLPLEVTPPPLAGAPPEGVLIGTPASKGLAIGQVYVFEDQMPTIEHTTIPTEALQGEQQRLSAALQAAVDELHVLQQEAQERIGKENAAIFEAHAMMLRDAELQQAAQTHITTHQHNAEFAWWQTIQALADEYHNAENELLQHRANDVLDVGRRVLRKLMPHPAPHVAPHLHNSSLAGIPNGIILVAPDLAPSDTAQLNPGKVRGILTRYGGATSHTAIIARSLAIPAVTGLGNGIARLREGQTIVVDGTTGRVYTEPNAEELHTFEQSIAQSRVVQQRLIAESRRPAMTPDGHQVEIAANIGKAADAATLLEMGAEAVGLFRTEFLFMDRPSAPSEAEQFSAYTSAAAQLTDCPVIIRTLDIGGDKAVAYLPIDAEENPFLGYRGIRYWIGNEALARTQLRAICRASAEHKIKVMFPMIGALEELQAAKHMLRAIQAELSAENLPFNPHMELGIMIEVPSAVLIADQLAPHVDFFSIGTNDLVQYIMAADRGNAKVSRLADPFQPSVLRAIQQVIEAAHVNGKWVGMCGEMAGNPLATPLLLGLGIDELSMSAPSIPEVKMLIRHTPYQAAQQIAKEALLLHTAADVRAYLEQAQTGNPPIITVTPPDS